MLQKFEPDLLILTEHGLKKTQLHNTNLINYTLVTDFSRLHHGKGGVAIFCKESLKTIIEPVYIENISVEMICETAIALIKIYNQCLYVIGTYRNKGNLEESLEIISQALEATPTWSCPVIVMGDININCMIPDRDEVKLEEMLTSHNMTRILLPPTRITPTSQSSIDCVCTNLEEAKISIKVLDLGISDHTAQLCEVICQRFETQTSAAVRRQFSERNLLTIKLRLGQESWDDVLGASYIDPAFNLFINTVSMIINHVCPLKRSRVKNKRKHRVMDREAERLREEFLREQALYNMTGLLEHKQETACKKKVYDLRLKELRRKEITNRIACSDNKSKTLWAIVNGERKPKTSCNPQQLITPGGEKITGPKNIADYLNLTFTSAADNALAANPRQPPTTVTQNYDAPPLTLYYTSVEEVEKVISSLKTKTSSGIDEVSSKLLKVCNEELAGPLSHLINMSFKEGKFPTCLKLTKVIPLFKQGITSDASNYRPISLVSTFSKVFEKVALTRLMKHVLQNHMLTRHQHGFIKGRSTMTAVINLVEFIVDQLEAGSTTTAVLLDFSKAFDCLDHCQLLKKLEAFGIVGTTARWFSSYLTGRRQVVDLAHTNRGTFSSVRSSPLPISRGVPQGSVLGPVLFVLFTNDLTEYLEEFAGAIMYADDTALLLANKHPETLNVSSYIAMNMAAQYCHNNNLVLNEAKTKQLVFGRRKEEVGVLPNIDIVDEAKYLGIVIDTGLKWTPHVDSLCSKLSSGLYVIRRIKSISDITVAITAYYALFESHLRYGLIVWGKSSVGNLQRPLVLQKKCIRILASLQPRDSCRTAFIELSILTVVSLYILETILYAHMNNLTRGSDLHAYNTRRAADFNLPGHHSSLYEEKPSYMGAKLFNALPTDIKNQRNLKNTLKRWLLHHPFYSVEEFLNWRTWDINQ